jgi:hypothetical protein
MAVCGRRFRILLQTAENHALDRGIEILHDFAGRRLAFAARLARKHLVQNQAERVDIASGSNIAARPLFGRHVRRRAAAQVA